MKEVMKDIILIVIVCLLILSFLFSSHINRFITVKGCQITNNSNLMNFIKDHEASLNAISDYLVQNPNIYFRSLGKRIFVYYKDDSEDSLEDSVPLALEFDSIPSDIQSCLNETMLGSKSEVWLESISMPDENGIEFIPHLQSDPAIVRFFYLKSGPAIVHIFLKLDGKKEELPGPFLLYNESVRWYKNFYISYGILRRE